MNGARACLLGSVNTRMYRTRFAIAFEKLPKSIDGATGVNHLLKSTILTHLQQLLYDAFGVFRTSLP
jgi:hypothetical protein